MNKLLILPEGDYIFTSNQVEGLRIDINQFTRILGLTPEPGWFGNEEVIVFIDSETLSEKEKIIEVERTNLLLDEIRFEEVNNVLDDVLFNIFNSI